MRKYRIRYDTNLEHKGIKGMRWGYNDGEPNGKRTASNPIKENPDDYKDFQIKLDPHPNLTKYNLKYNGESVSKFISKNLGTPISKIVRDKSKDIMIAINNRYPTIFEWDRKL